MDKLEASWSLKPNLKTCGMCSPAFPFLCISYLKLFFISFLDASRPCICRLFNTI